MTKAVVFDAYGTIVKIHERTYPYKQLKNLTDINGFKHLNPLTHPVTFEETVAFAGGSLKLPHLMDQLSIELKSIKEFADVKQTLEVLKKRGMKLVVCSNLAHPYAQPIVHIFGDVFDHYVWSFAEGYTKPDIEIYMAVEKALWMYGTDIHMVGDTFKADVESPRNFGWNSTLLDRTGDNQYDSISSLTQLLKLV